MTSSGPSLHSAGRSPCNPLPYGLGRQPFDHAALFYLDEESLLSTLCDFAVVSFESGGAVVIMATAAHRRALAGKLSDRVADFPSLRTQSRYFEIDVDEVLSSCMEGRKLNLEKLGLRLGEAIAAARQEPKMKTAPLFVFGEIVALLWARRDLENLHALELLGDGLGLGVSTVCGYPIREFAERGTEQAYLQICGLHSTVIPPESYPTEETERRILEATARSYARAREKPDHKS